MYTSLIYEKPFLVVYILATSICSIFAEQTNTVEWGAVNNGAQMSISPTNGTGKFIIGQPVILAFRYRNVSTNNNIIIFSLMAISRDSSYSISILSPSGKDVSPQLPIGIAGSGSAFGLEPQETKEIDVDMNNFCKFDEPGIYTITAKKLLFKNEKKTTVTSNTLKITISD